MSNEESIIIERIKDYIIKFSGAYSNWYVGIAQDPRTRLFNDHAVNEKLDFWIYQKVSSSNSARNIEQYFTDTLGTSGDTGGGDDNTDSVYAYKKSYRTKP